MNDTPNIPLGVDLTRPSPARLYDYYLGGTTRAEVERLFDGLELVPPYVGAEPAVTYVGLWGAQDPALADSDGSRGLYCGVARRPCFPAHGESVPVATGGLR